MNCEKCKNKIEEGQKFCSNCAEPIKITPKTEVKSDSVSQVGPIIEEAGSQIKITLIIVALGISLLLIIFAIISSGSENTSDTSNTFNENENVLDNSQQVNNIQEQPTISPSDDSVKVIKEVVPDNKTQEYKKILTDKILDIYATYEIRVKFADILIPAERDRINELSNLISKNNSFAENITDSLLLEVISHLNSLYTYDKNISESVLNILENSKTRDKEVMISLEKALASFSKEELITKSEFDKSNIDCNKMLKTADEGFESIKGFVQKNYNLQQKNSAMIQEIFDAIKIKISSLERDINYQRTQPSYISTPLPTIPVIPTPSRMTCSYNQYNGSYHGGTINCTSY